MKTFKQFLSEEEQTLHQFLEQHGKQLCTEVHGVQAIIEHPMYRGMSKCNGERVKFSDVERAGFICSAREGDRRPLDTHALLHNMIDEELKKRFGWAPRSRGMFCFNRSGSVNAQEYGTPYKICPLESFKYIWSPDVQDLYNKMTMLRLANPQNGLKRPSKVYNMADEDVQNWRHALQPVFDSYIDTGLNKFISGPPREIMLSCTKYLAIPGAKRAD